MRSIDSRSVDIVATRFMKEHFEVTDNGVGPLPAAANSAGFGDLDPTFAGCAHPMVDVDTEWELGCGEGERRVRGEER